MDAHENTQNSEKHLDLNDLSRETEITHTCSSEGTSQSLSDRLHDDNKTDISCNITHRGKSEPLPNNETVSCEEGDVKNDSSEVSEKVTVTNETENTNNTENSEALNIDATNKINCNDELECDKVTGEETSNANDDLPGVRTEDAETSRCHRQPDDDETFSDSSGDPSSAAHNTGSDESEADDEYESAEEGEEIHVDSQNLQDQEDTLTDEQKEERREAAQLLKDEGNELFRCGSFKSAIRLYSRGLRTCPLKFPKDRAIMYSNRAACKMKMQESEAAIKDCSKALELHPHYMKALMRRAELYEKTEKLDEALADFQKIVEMDPSQHSARAACMRLPGQIKERNGKLKEEMMGKLKDLGNMILRPFGLSTNNFQLNQDPNSGGYSVNFNQNPEAS